MVDLSLSLLYQNFVGLSTADDGYIACGSETNEVYSLILNSISSARVYLLRDLTD